MRWFSVQKPSGYFFAELCDEIAHSERPNMPAKSKTKLAKNITKLAKGATKLANRTWTHRLERCFYKRRLYQRMAYGTYNRVAAFSEQFVRRKFGRRWKLWRQAAAVKLVVAPSQLRTLHLLQFHEPHKNYIWLSNVKSIALYFWHLQMAKGVRIWLQILNL